MTNLNLFLMILGLFAVSYIPRVIPLLYFTKRKVPTWFSEWMKYVPVALFAALSFKDVFITHEHLDLAWNIKIVAMLLVAGVAYKTRSMALSVLTGLLAIFLLTML
ncbi:AzlD domain-containing protein [Enterococcus phoeniculicola]|uniref:Branched-chain amino acid transporter n=1 Tax=Enterococcus phoeniculicola ATCC BAA-412 TaxID=1158610 RepID=R3TJR0_9ENTE|nr:AzlD domain-containing protein [Enterococcus phoeniculicola]EOL41659.1 branched-chain amino acid transporter [Enterococcus phoeniculicola ATCC BAA-412]EOT78847.1 branched-chain amino acid transporter [Enterococcus phoeniculicola ATCC BAA-412]